LHPKALAAIRVRGQKDEFRNGEIFYTLQEAMVLLEARRHQHNTVRPHSSIDRRHQRFCCGRQPRHVDGHGAVSKFSLWLDTHLSLIESQGSCPPLEQIDLSPAKSWSHMEDNLALRLFPGVPSFPMIALN
jgi:hypothetical protein